MSKVGGKRKCLNVILHRSQCNARAVSIASTLHKPGTRDVKGVKGLANSHPQKQQHKWKQDFNNYVLFQILFLSCTSTPTFLCNDFLSVYNISFHYDFSVALSPVTVDHHCTCL